MATATATRTHKFEATLSCGHTSVYEVPADQTPVFPVRPHCPTCESKSNGRPRQRKLVSVKAVK